MFKHLFVICVVLGALVLCSDAKLPTPVYPSGCFFDVQKDTHGVWWFVDPNGKTFWSNGVDVINPNGQKDKTTGQQIYQTTINAEYRGNMALWAEATVQRMLTWQIDTMGAWTSDLLYDQHMPYVEVIDFYSSWRSESCPSCVVPDIYDPKFYDWVDRRIRLAVLPKLNDPYYMGSILDNEVYMGRNWVSGVPWLSYYLNFTTDSYGYKFALQFTQGIYATVADVNTAWGINIASWDKLNMITLSVGYQNKKTGAWSYLDDSRTFENITNVHYFNTTCSAIRRVDPNHLILGQKYNGYPSAYTSWADATYGSDVLSIDYYSNPPTNGNWAEVASMYSDEKQQKPILIGEFAIRGQDAGLPNTKGAGPTVATQAIRALDYAYTVQNLSTVSYMVGAWWFQWMDEPAGGRAGDGENSNYGLVNNTDVAYSALVSTMAAVNPTMEDRHGTTTHLTPKCGPRYTCPSGCSGNGHCNAASGRCVCNNYYSGGDCSVPTGIINIAFSSSTPYWTTFDISNGWYGGWRTYFRESNSIVLNSNNLQMNLNSTGCGTNCGGSAYAGSGLESIYDYPTGWLNISLKHSPYTHTFFNFRWFYESDSGVYDGLAYTLTNAAFTLYSIDGSNVFTSIFTTSLGFNASLAYHTYSIFWSQDNKILHFAIDGNVRYTNNSANRSASVASFMLLFESDDTMPAVSFATLNVASISYKQDLGVATYEPTSYPTSNPTSSPTSNPTSKPTTGVTTSIAPTPPNEGSPSASVFTSPNFVLVCSMLALVVFIHT